jgi:hypothetical protein
MEGLMEESESPVSQSVCRLIKLLVIIPVLGVALAAYLASVPRDPARPSIEARSTVPCADSSEEFPGGANHCAAISSGIDAASAPPDTGRLATQQQSRTAYGEPNQAEAPSWRELLLQEPETTIAELCAARPDDSDIRCRSWTWNGVGTNSAAAAEGNVASPWERTIAGRVIGTDGIGIGYMTVLASTLSHPADGDQTNSNAMPVRYRTKTDSTGFYSFHALPEGDYALRASGYGNYRSPRITVHTGVRYADIVLKETIPFAVQGRVISSEGYPLGGVTVLPVVTGVPSVVTNDDGYFHLSVALKSGVRAIELRFQNPGYHEEYASVGRGGLTAVNGTDVEIVMRPVRYWTAVSGTVNDAAGKAIIGQSVQLRPIRDRRRYATLTDDQGQFFFDAVEAPVEYQLRVSGGTDNADYSQRLLVTRDEADFHIVVEPYEFGEITGRLVDLDGSPIPDLQLALRNTASSTPNALIRSGADGSFALRKAPAGELVMASRSTPSILVRGVHLEPGEHLHVPLVLDWGEHEIRGLVLDRHGNPAAASRIVLKWFHHTGGISSRSTRRTAADAQGNFLFSQLGPGPHLLEVNAPGYPALTLDYDATRQGYDLTVRLN